MIIKIIIFSLQVIALIMQIIFLYRVNNKTKEIRKTVDNYCDTKK